MFLFIVMTIAELLAQSAQNLSQVPGVMSDMNKARLVRSANAGLDEFVTALPGTRRRERTAVRLDEAITKAITVTLNSKTIAFDAFADQASYLGRTVSIDVDSGRYNRLQSLNTLLFENSAPTGAATMQIASDAILLGGLEDVVEGEVVLSWGSGNKTLIHGKPEDWRRDSREFTAHVGQPQYWWCEGLSGISGGSNPQYVLRVWPQPEAAYDLVFQRRLWPSALTVAMLTSTTELPCLAREEWVLVALCQYGTISSNLWIGSANKDDAEKDYVRAQGYLEQFKGQRPSNRRGKFKTKPGF